jgi:cysteine-rich repeat protein
MRFRVPLGIWFTVAIIAACSVKDITDSAGSPPVEDCAASGDEDGNGLANCEDAACAGEAVCAAMCGNGRLDPGEQCDDGKGGIGDGCDSSCVASAVAYVKASNTGARDRFGTSVALSGDGSTLAVGAYQEASAATGINGDQVSNAAGSSGAVYVYVHSSGGTWSQQAYVKASNTDAGDQFGYSVELSGDGSTLAVGAVIEDSAATAINGDQVSNAAGFAGAAYVYARSSGTWNQQAYVKASNTGASDNFGYSVALSGDGSTLAVGALGEDSAATGINGDPTSNAAAQAGAVYVYR